MQVESEKRGKKKKNGTEQGVSVEPYTADIVTVEGVWCQRTPTRGKGSPTTENMSVCNNLTSMRLHVHLTNF